VTTNRFDYKKHCKTIKHNQEITIDEFSINVDKSQAKSFTCINCNKKYKDNSGLWKHKKLCKKNCEIDIITDSNEKLSNQITPELILSV